jgi:hypothetical protein
MGLFFKNRTSFSAAGSPVVARQAFEKAGTEFIDDLLGLQGGLDPDRR